MGIFFQKKMTEKFCLKWNDFYSNVSKSFGLFRNEEYLHDVTLVSDDHEKVSAHKLVLSASSEYFRDIFMNNKHSHPWICLDGISSEDLKNITDYIYNGEVNIFQDSLDRFLNIAQRLKLDGLIANETTKNELPHEETSNLGNVKSTQEIAATKMEVSQAKIEDVVTNVVAMNSNNINEINNKISEYLEECFDGNFRCTVCGKTSSTNKKKSSQKQTMQRHIETHMDGLTYTCSLCEKTFRSRHSLYVHKSVSHRTQARIQ